jgi:hypothetical protein
MPNGLNNLMNAKKNKVLFVFGDGLCAPTAKMTPV